MISGRETRVETSPSLAAWMVLVATMLASWAMPAAAQVSSGTQDRFVTAQRPVDAAGQRASGLQSRVEELRRQRAELDTNLRETARLIQDSEGRLTAIETRQKELTDQEEGLKATLSERHGTIAVLLGAMQRMGRNPPPVVITRREDALRMVRSAMILARAFPELSEQALALAGRISELARLRAEIDREAVRLREETARLNDQRTRIGQLMETKRDSLAELQPQLEAARLEAQRVAGRVKDLNELIGGLSKVSQSSDPPTPSPPPQRSAAAPAITPAPAPGTPLSSPAATMRATEPSSPPTLAPAPAATDPGTPQRPTVVAELAPQGVEMASLRPLALKPAKPFARTKGTLPLPAQGKRVLAFGDRTQYGAPSKGIVIETRHGAQIVSPSEGTVVYAGAFRTFGQLLIINAHDGYHILLAGLSQIDVQMGQFVLAGEPVGLMSPPPRSAQDKTKGNAPVLYVEFRKDNQPINPDPWWAVSTRKVQG